MNRKTTILALAAGTLFAAAPAFAQQTSNLNVDVTLTVQDGCTINGGSGTNPGTAVLSFGTLQNSVAQQVDVTGSTTANGGTPITISCNVDSTAASFALDGGQFTSSGSRRMRRTGAAGGSAGEFVPYRIFADSGFTQEYVISTALPIGSLTAGTPATLNLFGLILASDARSTVAGVYRDNPVIGTLSF